MNNDLINELNNKIDAQDKIINTQTLEIARLNKDLKDACYVIEKIKKEKQQAIKYLKEREEDNMCCSVCSVMSDKLLEILGDKEIE